MQTRPVLRAGGGWRGGEGPALGGIVRAAAKVDDEAGKGLTRAVEGAPREASVAGRPDDVGGLDRVSGLGEELEEPTRAEVELGRLGRGLDVLGVAQGGDGHVFALEDEAEGRRVAAEIGLDDLEAAQAVQAGAVVGCGCGRSGAGCAGRGCGLGESEISPGQY